MPDQVKRPVGRPPRPLPPQIDATPEEIARIVLQAPPKRDWRYQERPERPPARAAKPFCKSD